MTQKQLQGDWEKKLNNGTSCCHFIFHSWKKNKKKKRKKKRTLKITDVDRVLILHTEDQKQQQPKLREESEVT